MSLPTPDTIDRRIRLARVRWRKKQPKIADIPVAYDPACSNRGMTPVEMALASYSPGNISAIMMQRQR